MLQKLFILFLIFNLSLKAQSPELSVPEFGWALAHPFAALKVKRLTMKCNQLSSVSELRLKLDSFSNGGKADAYRHAFYMAAYAQKIKVKKLRKLGKAHEKANYKHFLKSKTEDGEVADSLSSVMDLLNNELGFVIGSSNKKSSLKDLSGLTVLEIQKGKAVIIKRNAKGQYLTCDEKVIDLGLYRGHWNVPKCLEASDK